MSPRPDDFFPSEPLDTTPEVFDDLVRALAELAEDPPPLTEESVARIEARIFDRAEESFDEEDLPVVLEGPVPARRLQGLRDLEVDPAPDPRPWFARPVSAPLSPAPVGGGWRHRARLIAVPLAAAYLFAAGLAWASGGAQPGSILYPVKLQVEALKLAFAGNDLARAERHIAVAADRLLTLGELDLSAAQIITLTADMDSAGLRALDLVKRAPASGYRTDVAGELLGLAVSERSRLSEMLWAAPAKAHPSVAMSLANAGHIQAEVSGLLMARTTPLPEIGPVPASVKPAAEPPAVRPVSQPRPAFNSPATAPADRSSPPPKSPPRSGPPSGGEPPGDPPCAVGSGEICIQLPDLPLGGGS